MMIDINVWNLLAFKKKAHDMTSLWKLHFQRLVPHHREEPSC